MSTPLAAAPFDSDPHSPRALWNNAVFTLVLEVLLVGPYLLFAITRGDLKGLLAPLIGTLMIAPLLLRLAAPKLMLALVTGAGLLHMLVFDTPTLAILAVPVAVYSFARWVDGSQSRVVLVIGAVAAVLGPIQWTKMFTPAAESSTLTMFTLMAIV